MRRDELMAAKTFVLNIALDPDKMTSYRDQDIVWEEKYHKISKQHMRWGPEYFIALLCDLG